MIGNHLWCFLTCEWITSSSAATFRSLSSLCLFVSSSVSSKETLIKFWVSLIQYDLILIFTLLTSEKTLFQIRSYSEVPGEHDFREDITQPAIIYSLASQNSHPVHAQNSHPVQVLVHSSINSEFHISYKYHQLIKSQVSLSKSSVSDVLGFIHPVANVFFIYGPMKQTKKKKTNYLLPKCRDSQRIAFPSPQRKVGGIKRS